MFTGISTAIMAVTGTHLLATRLAFQLLAAFAVLAAMFLVYRRTRDPVALLLIGVNPVIALEVVNTGRNDALVGLAILAGVAAGRAPPVLAGAAVVALAALVKIVALAALGGLLVWVWRRLGPRVAAQGAALSRGCSSWVTQRLAGPARCGRSPTRPIVSAGPRSGSWRGPTASSISSGPRRPSRSAT